MQVVLHQIVCQIIRMNVSDTQNSDQAKRACQSPSCSIEYSSFIYIYMRYFISILQVLITTDEGCPKRKISYVGFILIFFVHSSPATRLLARI